MDNPMQCDAIRYDTIDLSDNNILKTRQGEDDMETQG